MTTEKPKITRTHVTLTDPETRESRGLTLYGVERDELYAQLAGKPPEKDEPKPAERHARKSA